jgi:hypothetical protein
MEDMKNAYKNVVGWENNIKIEPIEECVDGMERARQHVQTSRLLIKKFHCQ